jgi:hypothetical protein
MSVIFTRDTDAEHTGIVWWIYHTLCVLGSKKVLLEALPWSPERFNKARRSLQRDEEKVIKCAFAMFRTVLTFPFKVRRLILD